ncbi:MAG: outer membrane lipoprotein-sorting protein, partial [Bacteroidota bacterium]
KMVKADGEEMYHFFDTELYIPVMTRTFAKMGPMKGQAIETYVSDYDEVDGLIVPFSIEQKLGGQTFMQMTAESVKFNIEVADEFFSMPAGN